MAAVEATLKTNWIAQGEQVKSTEQSFNNFFSGGSSCAVSSGSAALFLALKALGAGKDSYVALPTYACSALLNAVYMVGAKPVLVDVQEENFCINVQQLENILDDISHVLAVHTFGAIADLSSLKKSKVKVIEDCCQSFGALKHFEIADKYSDALVFSFYATKLITGGQGGLVWSSNDYIIKSVTDYREFDCRKDYTPRFNLQMSDIEAALVNSQLKRLSKIRDRRHMIARQYSNNLTSELRIQQGPCHATGIPYRYVIKTPTKQIRDRLYDHMVSNNIRCAIPIERYELLHRYLKLNPLSFPIAEKIVDTSVSIPIHGGLSNDHIDHISTALSQFKV